MYADGWIRTAKLAVSATLGFVRFDSEFTLAPVPRNATRYYFQQPVPFYDPLKHKFSV